MKDKKGLGLLLMGSPDDEFEDEDTEEYDESYPEEFGELAEDVFNTDMSLEDRKMALYEAIKSCK